MKGVAGALLGIIGSSFRRLGRRMVGDVLVDVHSGISWITEVGPKTISWITEKWLGFWYAFFLTFIVGLGGLGLVESAKSIVNHSLVPDSVFWLLAIIVVVGYGVVLLWGMMFFALMAVSIVRVLFWARDIWKRFWRMNTPPFPEYEKGEDSQQWPPSDDRVSKARKKSWESFKIGAFWFPVFTAIILVIYWVSSESLDAVAGDMDLSFLAEIVTATVWFVDVGSLLELIGLSTLSLEVIAILVVMAVPTIYMAISTRNLLFATEAYIRSRIAKSSEGSRFGWRRLLLAGQFLLCWTYAIGFISVLI